jgi:NADPH:quinone reductase-like Zn-dependent oxidoreductase
LASKLIGQGFGNVRYKRVVVTQYSGPEVITTTEEDISTPKADEVRVKVLAAEVGLPDVPAREKIKRYSGCCHGRPSPALERQPQVRAA